MEFILSASYLEFTWFLLCGIVMFYVIKLTYLDSWMASVSASNHTRKFSHIRAPPMITRAKLIRILLGCLCIASILKIFYSRPSDPSVVLRGIGSEKNENSLSKPKMITSRCECDKKLAKNVLIILARPWRFFTSAHWFHICEYYLPHHSSAAKHLQTNSTIFIMAPHDRFVAELTRITYLLLMVAFTNGAPARVEVVPPSAVLKSSNDKDYATIYSISGSFIFDGLLQNPSERFIRSNGSNFPSYISTDLNNKKCACAHIIGEYGAAPVERGFWFRSNEAVQKTRETLHRLCSPFPLKPPPKTDSFVYGQNRFHYSNDDHSQHHKEKSQKKHWTTKIGASIVQNAGLSAPSFFNVSTPIPQNKSPPKWKLIIYQRNRDRKLLRHDQAAYELKQRLGKDWIVDIVMHDDLYHPCILLDMFRDSDVLLTPHGFQTMLLIFMPQGSAVFEIFPFKYWKDGYRPFANEYGMFHGWSQNKRSTSWQRNFALSFISQTACMQWAACREYARRDDVSIDDIALNSIVVLAQRSSGMNHSNLIKSTHQTSQNNKRKQSYMKTFFRKAKWRW